MPNMAARTFLVLIETLWNVKQNDNGTLQERLRRINRNIVECKVFFPLLKLKFYCVLIETLWNVKYCLRCVFDICPGINRNIVECKADRIHEKERLNVRY